MGKDGRPVRRSPVYRAASKSTKRKTSTCEAGICFSCALNEQTVCEADGEAPQARVCEYEIRTAKKKNKHLRSKKETKRGAT